MQEKRLRRVFRSFLARVRSLAVLLFSPLQLRNPVLGARKSLERAQRKRRSEMNLSPIVYT